MNNKKKINKRLNKQLQRQNKNRDRVRSRNRKKNKTKQITVIPQLCPRGRSINLSSFILVTGLGNQLVTEGRCIFNRIGSGDLMPLL